MQSSLDGLTLSKIMIFLRDSILTESGEARKKKKFHFVKDTYNVDISSSSVTYLSLVTSNYCTRSWFRTIIHLKNVHRDARQPQYMK